VDGATLMDDASAAPATSVPPSTGWAWDRSGPIKLRRPRAQRVGQPNVNA
jgi:hypothetical protein